MYHVFSVCISNMRPSPLDICPRLRLGQISRGLGLILLIHTSKPWYIYYIYTRPHQRDDVIILYKCDIALEALNKIYIYAGIYTGFFIGGGSMGTLPV